MARSLLRSKDVRLITLAVGLSAMGDWLALAPSRPPSRRLDRFRVRPGRPDGVTVAPSVLLAGPAGRIVDRVEARALLIWVSLAQAVVAAGLALVSGTAAILALTT